MSKPVWGKHGQKRDKNEDEIVDALVAAGCAVLKMDKSAGFDLLVFSPRTGIHVMEVKSLAGTLTENERKAMNIMSNLYIRYAVVRNISEALLEVE